MAAVVIEAKKGNDVVAPSVKIPARFLPEIEKSRAVATIDQAKPLILSIIKDISMDAGVSLEAAEEVVDQIATCMDDNSKALIEVTRLKSRDEYTFLHSISVAALMVQLGRSIQMDEKVIKTLAMGGLLHDVGKVKLPLEILNKIGKLTDEEMALVRNHPQYSYELLSKQGDVPPRSSTSVCIITNDWMAGC
ncbi:HD-GYP domain-containing protein [Agrobacterium tumefaciens]|uniref:HD-GYP domain-containing protein n=1 Tax=Agrobacterium tumefaciens TaxID=358 RepID=UPI00384B6D49